MPPHNQALRQQFIRSLAEEGVTPRAVPYRTTSYSAFQISDDGRTYEIDGLLAGSLDDAMQQAVILRSFSHKQHLLIREEGERGSKLHLFAVKKRATPRFEHRDHVTRRINDLYLAPVCSIDGVAL